MTTGTKTSLKKRSRALQTLSRLFHVLHVQGCFFANLTYCVLVDVAVVDAYNKLNDDKDRLRYRQRLLRFPAKMTLVNARAILCSPRGRHRLRI